MPDSPSGRVWLLFLIELNMQPPSDPAIAVLGIYPREMKTHKNLYMHAPSSFLHNSQRPETAQTSFKG